ncbi:hypothetical protein BD410DRAFT_180959 [Rickenella mellea]|uniref:Uncharacterized protein n=1 Tax=Rickenella mellea TaxID=50990 RepID=A0A4Y7PH18_9AGAM|nr:hypothetical protein BD410DRAFT_180959 [Rickenella mellea]
MQWWQRKVSVIYSLCSRIALQLLCLFSHSILSRSMASALFLSPRGSLQYGLPFHLQLKLRPTQEVVLKEYERLRREGKKSTSRNVQEDASDGRRLPIPSYILSLLCTQITKTHGRKRILKSGEDGRAYSQPIGDTWAEPESSKRWISEETVHQSHVDPKGERKAAQQAPFKLNTEVRKASSRRHGPEWVTKNGVRYAAREGHELNIETRREKEFSGKKKVVNGASESTELLLEDSEHHRLNPLTPKRSAKPDKNMDVWVDLEKKHVANEKRQRRKLRKKRPEEYHRPKFIVNGKAHGYTTY